METSKAARNESAPPGPADRSGRRGVRTTSNGSATVRTVVSRGAPPVALALWLLSLHHVRLGQMGDLGLLQVLPVLFWVALGLLTVGFVVTLQAERIGRYWPAVYVVSLIAIIHATPSILYPTLRYSWAWKHVDVVDALLRNAGAVPHPGWLDIYNQWPGFFVSNGLVLRLTGLHSAMGYAHWATPVVNVLMIGPLLLLYRSFTNERKLVWGAVWIFFSCSWIGQDYFAPQTFDFLLYMTVIALVVKQLGTGERWRRPLLVMVLLMVTVLISSHQLTPLMLIATLTALSLRRRYRRTVAPVLVFAVVVQAVWFSTAARPYIAENIRSFIKAITSPDSNAPTWLTGLGTPAPGQFLLAWIDRGLSAAVLLLALTALIRRPWTRRTALPLLAVAPLPMPAVNSYGGEMIFRAFMFALPATAMLTATLVFEVRPGSLLRRLGRPAGVVRAVLTGALLFGFLGGLVFGYYGKEQMEFFTAKEAAATAYMYRVAPTGSTIYSVTNNIPNIDFDYDLHRRVVIAWNSVENRRLLLRDPLAGLEQAVSLDAPPGPVYLILNRGQTAECYITGVLPAGTVSRLESAVDHSRIFAPVYRNSDAVVYVLVDRTAPALQPRPQTHQPQRSQPPGGGR